MPLQRLVGFAEIAPWQTFIIMEAGMEITTKKQSKLPVLNNLVAKSFLTHLHLQEDRPAEITIEMMRRNGKGVELTGAAIWKRFSESRAVMRNILLPAWNEMIGPDGKLQSGKQWEDAVNALCEAAWSAKQVKLSDKRKKAAKKKTDGKLPENASPQSKTANQNEGDGEADGADENVDDDDEPAADSGPREMPQGWVPAELKFFLVKGAPCQHFGDIPCQEFAKQLASGPSGKSKEDGIYSKPLPGATGSRDGTSRKNQRAEETLDKIEKDHEHRNGVMDKMLQLVQNNSSKAEQAAADDMRGNQISQLQWIISNIKDQAAVRAATERLLKLMDLPVMVENVDPVPEAQLVNVVPEQQEKDDETEPDIQEQDSADNAKILQTPPPPPASSVLDKPEPDNKRKRATTNYRTLSGYGNSDTQGAKRKK